MTVNPIPQSVPMIRESHKSVSAEQLRNLPAAQERVVVSVPNHSLCSYGHGQNDSYTHPISGVVMERTVAVKELEAPAVSTAPTTAVHAQSHGSKTTSNVTSHLQNLLAGPRR